MSSTLTERPPVTRTRRLPAGVTETFSKVTERIIERPVHGANVYRHIYGQRATFCIDGLDIDEAHRLALMLQDDDVLDYVGVALGRSIYPTTTEEETR